MIAVACAIDDDDAYPLRAGRGLARLAADPQVQCWPMALALTLARTYNLILDRARGTDGLEALVIVDQQTEITDMRLPAIVREALSDPEVAIAGIAGARGDHGLAWWRGEVSCGPVTLRYTDYGGGAVPAFAWTRPEPAPAPVDALDGAVLILSPWAVENLRFDERFFYRFGLDVDLCRQAAAAGRSVRTVPLEATLHRQLDVIPDEWTAAWVDSHILFARTWDTGPADPDDDAWRERARTSEAERDAARTFAQGLHFTAEAQIARLQAALNEIDGSRSWRLTEPLRAVNASRRARRGA